METQRGFTVLFVALFLLLFSGECSRHCEKHPSDPGCQALGKIPPSGITQQKAVSSHCLVHPEDCQSSQHPDEIANHVKEDEISDDAKEDEILASGCSQVVQEDRHPKEVDESVTVTAVQHGLQKLALSDGTVSRQRMAKDGLPSPSSTGAAEQQGAGSTFVQEVETGVEGGVVPALESLQDLRISDSEHSQERPSHNSSSGAAASQCLELELTNSFHEESRSLQQPLVPSEDLDIDQLSSDFTKQLVIAKLAEIKANEEMARRKIEFYENRRRESVANVQVARKKWEAYEQQQKDRLLSRTVAWFKWVLFFNVGTLFVVWLYEMSEVHAYVLDSLFASVCSRVWALPGLSRFAGMLPDWIVLPFGLVVLSMLSYLSTLLGGSAGMILIVVLLHEFRTSLLRLLIYYVPVTIPLCYSMFICTFTCKDIQHVVALYVSVLLLSEVITLAIARAAWSTDPHNPFAQDGWIDAATQLFYF